MIKKISVNCVICGKEFDILPYRIEKINGGNCCSYECLGIKNKAKPNVKCYICGKEFHVKPFHLSKMKNPERICCSMECSKLERSERFQAENNHQFGLLGELNSSFKNDIRISTNNYILIRSINHPSRDRYGFILFHRLIMEEHLKETNNFDYLDYDEKTNFYFLSNDFIVHHKDENKFNNIIDNLEIMTLSEHTTYHNLKNPVNKNIYDGRFEEGQIKGKQLYKKNFDDAGQDITANEDVDINPKESKLIGTGTYIKIPHNHVGLLWSRSGLSVKNKLEVGAGCIDENYRGEVKVHLYNFSDQIYNVKKGDRIAQLLTIPINLQLYKVSDELSDTERGTGGFGSTGK